MPLAVSLLLLNLQYILSKVSLNRKHTKKGCIDQVDEYVMTRGLQDPNSVSPLGLVAQYFLIQCLQYRR